MARSPDWRQKIRDEVEIAFAEPSGEAEIARALAFAAAAAARGRGMSQRAYVRRCVIAMVAHDLEMTYAEAVALDPRLLGTVGIGPDLAGKTYGRFEIAKLVGEGP